MPSRRDFLRGAVCWTGLACVVRGKSVAARPAESLGAALDFLAGHQSRDGAWRSERHAAFREGDALTPLVLWAMQGVPAGHARGEAFARGLRWLKRTTDTQRERTESWAGLRYPLFTASYAAQVFEATGDARRARFWVAMLGSLRARPELGWPADHPGCGAWGDASVPPRFTEPLPDMLAPNISATALALQALANGPQAADRTAARRFAESCHNFHASAPAPFDDGGFFFALDDPIRNKAGAAGRDAAGRMRFCSYGSATCDGWLALRACGLSREHPRLRAAAEWLRKNERTAHPGGWTPSREAAGEALVFYYAQALAGVLADLARHEEWAAARQQALHSQLRAQQAPDGSWSGSAPDSCEDEPLLATAFALRALTA